MCSLHSLVWILTLSCCATAGKYTVGTFAGGLIPRPDNLTANSPIGSPVGVAADRFGNVYFASWNCIFQVDAGGNVKRIAGDYSAGQATGNTGGPPGFSWPSQYAGMAVTQGGSIIVPVGNAIWEIFGSGSVQQLTIQGTLHTPTHVAADNNGNIYASELFGGRIDKISPTGVVTAYVGGGQGNPLSGGQATGASLSQPNGLAVDAAGNLYFVDNGYGRVFKVAPDGTLTVLAGSGTGANINGYSGDGGAATSAQLDFPTELAVDGAGNVYIGSTGNHVRKVAPNGIISTVAGNGDWGYSGAGGPASKASVSPHGLATDSAGNLYIADFGSNRIRKVAPDGTISTVAGNGAYGYSTGDSGPAAEAQLSLPGAVAFDTGGNLYVADIGNNKVRKIAADGTITTVAGNGNPGYAGDGGPAISAEIVPSGGLAVDSKGNLYIRDSHGIRKVTTDGVINTIPGTTPQFPVAAPGTAGQYALSLGGTAGNGLAADGAGNVFEEGPPATGVDKIGADGSFSFVLSDHYFPEAIAADATGTLYWYSGYDRQLYQIAPGDPSNIFAPLPTLGDGCGFPPSIVEAEWSALASDAAGNVYAAENDPSGVPVIRKYVASGASYFVELSGVGAPFRIDTMAVDGAGNIYASDSANNVIHLLKLVAETPGITAVANAASNLAGPIAPGEIVVIYGQRLGPSQLTQCQYGAAGLVDPQLNGTQVLFNGTPAGVLYSSATQVATVVPASLGGGSVKVMVVYQGQASGPMSVPVAAAAPALFTLDSSGKGRAAAVNLDGTINGPANPVKAGSYLSLYATGGGQNLPVTVTIGGQAVTPQFAGQAPGYLTGLMQVNAQIPAGVAGGAVAVAIQVGGVSSPAGVTIAVAGQ